MNATTGPASPLPEGRADGPAIEAAEGQATAKALWKSLPAGAPVVVEFLGSGPRLARRTDIGWESDDGDTSVGCTPWSVRLDEVYIRADVAAPVVAVPEAGEREATLTAQEWCEALGWHILDPDGWREDGTPWLTSISRADFEHRAAMSTARGPDYWPPAVPVGVQPEPAEGRCRYCGHQTENADNVCGPCAAAVPVVHPEPGDQPMAHHPKCFQSTRTPEQLLADGLAPDQCDCRMLRMIDAAQCPNGCGPGFACSDCPSPPPTREQLIALVDSLLAENERLDADNASLVANNEGLAADRERVELGADAAVAAAVDAVRADRDRLAGQVAAIRALCDEAEAWARPTGSGAPHVSIDRIRAALVASSPTTPEAPK